MICYRDMAFCPFHVGCKKGRTCFRALTDEVKITASEIDLPICTFGSEPSCFVKKSVKEKDNGQEKA